MLQTSVQVPLHETQKNCGFIKKKKNNTATMGLIHVTF